MATFFSALNTIDLLGACVNLLMSWPRKAALETFFSSIKNPPDLSIVTDTVLRFSVFPLACGSCTSMVFNCLANVEAIMKKINKRKTTSVIEDMLNSGLTLLRPRKFILCGFVQQIQKF